MFATLKRLRKFYDVEIVTRPHPILIIAECAKTSQPMEFDQTIFLATAKKSLARETKRHGVVQAGVHVVEAWCCPSW